eukprot:gnl/TRDRNA2_/TRDRNA2_66338_c0_seq1.p1 gnl/TRDRNA2_/TRDRNA2_66338_c0~~gnl/TRDRNA2_/TRDRNA2_66338_c0_seq1.p1  ORF type:complete len:105 (+),score=1.61 gnl/TRDRNA2_/TRDRNA2_66338_c0_seq1:208-522(+)
MIGFMQAWRGLASISSSCAANLGHQMHRCPSGDLPNICFELPLVDLRDFLPCAVVHGFCGVLMDGTLYTGQNLHLCPGCRSTAFGVRDCKAKCSRCSCVAPDKL